MTTDHLARMPDTSLAELDEVSTGMQAYIRAANQEARQATWDAMRRRGLMQRLFPNEMERERQRGAVESIRQLAESKREFLALYTTTQFAIARKRADALVAAQGMQVQTQLARFANEKIHDLSATVNSSRARFMEEIEPQFTMIERFRHRPELHDRAVDSLNHQIDTYFESTKTLLDGFIQSLKNRVNQIQV